jgi:hypothetical protein
MPRPHSFQRLLFAGTPGLFPMHRFRFIHFQIEARVCQKALFRALVTVEEELQVVVLRYELAIRDEGGGRLRGVERPRGPCADPNEAAKSKEGRALEDRSAFVSEAEAARSKERNATTGHRFAVTRWRREGDLNRRVPSNRGFAAILEAFVILRR